MKWFRGNIGIARGVFIAPQMLRGAFLIGGSRGSGLLLARDLATGKWSYPGFYAINSVSTGLQIGADASEIILLVMTEQGMNAMLSSEFKIDSEGMVAAGPIGDASPQDSADILAFARSMRGSISGVSLAGAVITPRSSLNTAYYGRPVNLEDILVRQMVSNYKAESLRRRIATAPKAPARY
ncbi:MAG: lipid-binding SYLF domain-containing protein [Candidatus Electrothrix sp. Rat3]|nr:lipid-binding SYLF domain-containing protein [Candidatus Electrothrix rattekaaiensis]